jgi:16S rRNA (guanine527-N7)-methyltransferase
VNEKVFHNLLEKGDLSPKIVDKLFFNNSAFFMTANGVRMKQPKGRKMTIEELVHECSLMGVGIDEKQKEQLVRYAVLLQEWNQKMNLTAVDEPEEIYERHDLDCIRPLSDAYFSGNILDVGSGAGFPGMVWKIVRPDLMVTLLEPTGKRCSFLHAVQEDLNLTGLFIINQRAEEYIKEKRACFDVVTARAVAPLPVLSELCIPFVRKGGLFLAMKGSRGREEMTQAAHAVRVLGCEEEQVKVHAGKDGTGINIFYRKTADTPVRYPRNYGQIKKKPL